MKQDMLAGAFGAVLATAVAVYEARRLLEIDYETSEGTYIGVFISIGIVYLVFSTSAGMAKELFAYFRSKPALQQLAEQWQAKSTKTRPRRQTFDSTPLFFVLLLLILASAQVSGDTVLVFAFVPFLLSLIVPRPRTTLVTMLVAAGIWAARRLFETAPEGIPYYYYAAIGGTLAVFMIADRFDLWHRFTGRRSVAP